jgi:hypothetical protein
METSPALRDKTRLAHASLVRDYTRAASQCAPHRAWLGSL